MKIALAQLRPDPDAGMAMVERAAREGAKLIVFPELGFVPFFPQRRGATPATEPIPGPTTDRFAAAAKRHGIVTVLNLNDGHDSSPVIDADGRLLGVTRMAHIAQFEGFWEKDYYAPGRVPPPLYDTAVGRLGVAICYDRHFPEYMRALAGADLVVVPQAGCRGERPDGLFEAELRVAAFQNGTFAAPANRVGSFAVDPHGRVIAQAPADEEHLLIVDLDMRELATCAARTKFLPDRI